MTPSKGKDSHRSDWKKKNIYYSYFLTCSADSFGFFFFFPPLLLQLSILLALRNPIKPLSFFSSSVSFFIVINICLYIELLQFCRVFLFFFFFSFFNFLNLLLFFLFVPLFAFPTILFRFQLIFTIYKPSLSTSI